MTNEEQIQQAKANLERIRNDFKDQPDLLAVYEPSALHLIEVLEQKARNRQSSDRWKANNVERNKAKQLEYYRTHREERLAYMREYVKTHPRKPVSPEKMKEYSANPKSVERRKAYWQKWYVENKERRKPQQKANYEARKAKKKEESSETNG